MFQVALVKASTGYLKMSKANFAEMRFSEEAEFLQS